MIIVTRLGKHCISHMLQIAGDVTVWIQSSPTPIIIYRFIQLYYGTYGHRQSVQFLVLKSYNFQAKRQAGDGRVCKEQRRCHVKLNINALVDVEEH